VDFAAGTKDVFCTYPAEQAVTLDDIQTLTNKTLTSPTITGGTIDNTVIGGATPAAGTFTTLTSNGLTTLTNGTTIFSIEDGGGTSSQFRLIGPTASLGRNRIHSPAQLRLTTNNNPIQFQTGAGTTINSDGSAQLVVAHTTSAVNFVRVTGAATGGVPNISAQGSDTNIDLALTPKGTGAVVANGPFTATGQTSLGGAADSESLRVLQPVAAAGLRLQAGVPSSTVVRLGPAGAAVADFRIIAPTFINFYTGSSVNGLVDGAAQMRVSHTASAVNYVQVTGAATNAAPTISAQGSDANIFLDIRSKGFRPISFYTGASSPQFTVAHTNSTANYWQVTGGAAGAAPVMSVIGSDTNISQVFQSKGTGAINLAPGSRGVNISNGGTVTAITRTAAGSGYTSLPAIAISAPTTAGGVQATASIALTGITLSVAGGGTGYTAGDILTLVGGTGTAQQISVSTVSGGVITGVAGFQQGAYTAVPTNPISVTGGTGTGATINVTSYGINSTLTITNAGSGYVEQPTVTFSGGGGSGAAAYATVGAGTSVKSLGTTVSFSTPAGESFRVEQATSFGSGYWRAQGSAITPSLFASGANGIIGTGSSGVLQFAPGNTEQLRVAHTASAVNYVQVTGAATGSGPVISAQGSDTNVGMAFRGKGSGFITFGQDSTNQFEIIRTASAVNRFRVTGSTAGNAPIMSSEGSDTNIDLALTPKGTGNVRFGTYTADMTLIVQGYVEIKDSGGTIRKLAVIA
jgi:hypothetical protein